MLRKLLPALFLFSFLATSVFAADWWVMPYGSYSTFFDHSGDSVQFDNPAYSGPSIPDSQVANGLGGGIMLGAALDSIDGILGFNVEFFGGSKDHGLAEQDTLLGSSTLDFKAPSLAVSAFLASELPWLTNSKFRGLLGFECGFLMPQGSITFKYTEKTIDLDNPGEYLYEEKEETQDLGGAHPFFSLFLMEDFVFTERFGLSAGIGYRLMSNSAHSVSTPSMSGKYYQEYGGFSARLGVRIDI